MVAGDEVLWVFGTNNHNTTDGKHARSQIHVFWSGDPNLAAESWRHAVVVQLHEGWTAYNTSPARGELDGNSVHGVAIELGTPAVVRGEGFSSIFAVCDDCDKTPSFHGSKGWRLLDPSKSIYSKDRYAACPTFRWFAGYWYIVTLFRGYDVSLCGYPAVPNSTGCGTEHMARSKDLVVWEESKYGGHNSVLMGFSDGSDTLGPDHTILAGSFLDEHGTGAEREFVANATDDWNRSDMDMVTLPSGETYVIWMSGDQGHVYFPDINPRVTIASVAAIVNGTEQEWLESHFQ
jgi:DNA replicative helicase MCM subunit Mcm2 (Cdc46/Mcm family)